MEVENSLHPPLLPTFHIFNIVTIRKFDLALHDLLTVVERTPASKNRSHPTDWDRVKRVTLSDEIMAQV